MPCGLKHKWNDNWDVIIKDRKFQYDFRNNEKRVPSGQGSYSKD